MAVAEQGRNSLQALAVGGAAVGVAISRRVRLDNQFAWFGQQAMMYAADTTEHILVSSGHKDPDG